MPSLGVLALLLSTTHLHYTQNMMENNYIFLLTLTGFSYQYEWLRNGNRRALLIGSGAFGLNLLTRLTTGMDLLAERLFRAACPVVRRHPRPGPLESLPDLHRDRSTGLRVFRLDRPPLSVLSLWVVLQYLHERGRSRSQAAQSGSARQLSV